MVVRLLGVNRPCHSRGRGLRSIGAHSHAVDRVRFSCELADVLATHNFACQVHVHGSSGTQHVSELLLNSHDVQLRLVLPVDLADPLEDLADGVALAFHLIPVFAVERGHTLEDLDERGHAVPR